MKFSSQNHRAEHAGKVGEPPGHSARAQREARGQLPRARHEDAQPDARGGLEPRGHGHVRAHRVQPAAAATTPAALVALRQSRDLRPRHDQSRGRGPEETVVQGAVTAARRDRDYR